VTLERRDGAGIIGNSRRKLGRIACSLWAALRLLLEHDELRDLTDRELRDIGLSRYDVAKWRRVWRRFSDEPCDDRSRGS
jgi:uncharacterized protein YjiS (DUF1127 family)